MPGYRHSAPVDTHQRSFLSRIQREGLLLEPDFGVRVPELDLTVGVEDRTVGLVSQNRILHDAVAARGDDDHLLRPENNPADNFFPLIFKHLIFWQLFPSFRAGEWRSPFIVLPDVGLRADLDPGHVGGLVQDMQVVVRGDPEYGFVARWAFGNCGCRHFHRVRPRT